MLRVVYGKTVMKKLVVFKWNKKFNRRKDVKDDQRSEKMQKSW